MLAGICLILAALSVMSFVSLPVRSLPETDVYEYPDRYLLAQSEAIAEAEHREFCYEGIYEPVHFNEKGNVSQAGTAVFVKGDSVREIVIELGAGKLVFR